jgi:AcrR family transcriptional regulator
MSERGKRDEQSEQTRLRLLDAGLSVLGEQPTDKLFEKLQARPIAARAGLSTGAFYHHFVGPDEYIEALLHHSLERRPNPELAVSMPEFEARARDGASFVEAFLPMTDRMLEFNRSDPTFKLMLAVAAKAPRDREIRDRLKSMYAVATAEVADYCDLTRELLGREWRPPFTKQDLADAFLAMYEGLGLRQSVDPEAVPPERFGLLLLTIIELMSRPTGSSEDVNSWLEEKAPSWAAQAPFEAQA